MSNYTYKRQRNEVGCLAAIGVIVTAIALAFLLFAGVAAIYALIGMGIWNWLIVPHTTGTATVEFPLAFGIAALALLVKTIFSRSNGKSE